jgi:hypothetical protein
MYQNATTHFTSSSSALTLGGGYDMKEKTANTIKSDLVSVGVESANAECCPKLMDSLALSLKSS